MPTLLLQRAICWRCRSPEVKSRPAHLWFSHVPFDSCTGSSLKASQKPLQRKQLLATAPAKWQVSVLGRAHSSLKLSFQVLWLSAHPSTGNKACAFPFYFANITEDTLAKGKRKEPLSSVEMYLFFPPPFFSPHTKKITGAQGHTRTRISSNVNNINSHHICELPRHFFDYTLLQPPDFLQEVTYPSPPADSGCIRSLVVGSPKHTRAQ